GADLSEFDGNRYLRYEAFLTTSDSATTPSIDSVQVCFVDVTPAVATSLAVAPATGTQGGTTDLAATLTSGATGATGATGVSGATVDFSLNGNGVGSAVTASDGSATLSNVGLTGITAGVYPGGVAASFAGDTGHDGTTGANTLTVNAPAAVSPSPGSKDFGSQRVGTTGAAQTFTITNSGGATLNVSSAGVVGADGSQYVASNDTCSGQAVAPTGSCSVDVAFAPTSAGAHNGASLRIVSDAASSPDDLALSGTGVVPALSPSPGSKDFGSQRVGTTGAAQTFTITNSGGATLNVSSAGVVGADGSQYVASNDTCSGQAVAPTGSCSVDVSFAPTSAGAHNGASLRIVSDAASSPDDLALSGTGVVPALSPSPGSKDFGFQRVGTTGAAQTFTITNSGTAGLSVATATLVGT